MRNGDFCAANSHVRFSFVRVIKVDAYVGTSLPQLCAAAPSQSRVHPILLHARTFRILSPNRRSTKAASCHLLNERVEFRDLCIRCASLGFSSKYLRIEFFLCIFIMVRNDRSSISYEHFANW